MGNTIMQVGTGPLAFDLAGARMLAVRRQPTAPPIADIPTAVRNALETPLNFPALRRALTPDDHVAIVVDEHLPDLPSLLMPLLEHLVQAHITPDAITLICTENAGSHPWVESLPADFRHVKVEDHDSHNRKKLSYLATTKQGRRVYLNRTAVDADQLIVVSRRFYDPLLGIGGAEGAIYPALSDGETQKTLAKKLSMTAPDDTLWPIQLEAREVAWLLGAPFFVQVIEGPGNELANILGGVIDSSAEGQRLLNARWRVEVKEPADMVIAEVGGDPSTHSFADLARALAGASRVVKPEGKIVLVSEASPELGPGAALLRQADTADDALRLLKEMQPYDLPAAFQWACAAQRASLYLLTKLPAGIVEEMLATPLTQASDVARLAGKGLCLLIPDADKTLAVIS